MRLVFCSAAIILLSALAAQADLTIKADINTAAAGQARTVHLTTSIKGNKVCTVTTMDPPAGLPAAFAAQMPGLQTIIIADRQTGVRTLLMPARKMKMTLPPVTTQPSVPDAAQANQPSPFTATGKTDTIDGVTVAEYATNDPQHPISVWTAKDYPNADQIRPQLQDWIASAQRQHFPSMDQVPGIPLKFDVQSSRDGMAFEMTMTISSISVDAVSDDLFTIPDDYQEMQAGRGAGMIPGGQ